MMPQEYRRNNKSHIRRCSDSGERSRAYWHNAHYCEHSTGKSGQRKTVGYNTSDASQLPQDKPVVYRIQPASVKKNMLGLRREADYSRESLSISLLV